jgi:outer membrane protein TolC
MRTPVVIAVLFVPWAAASPQAPRRAPLDALVAEALEHNLGRREQALAVARAEAGVREARGLYLPSATLHARYTEVAGNTINLGDMINPAFGALNELLQRPAFPTNVDLQLPLRQETTLRLAQPVYQPSIAAANRIAGAVADLQDAASMAHARALATRVRSGYLTYAKLHFVVGVYDTTLALLDEHVRVAERLVSSGQATPDVVLRARAERSDVVQRRDEAAQLRDAARQSLNTALNRPTDTALEILPESTLVGEALPELAVSRSTALSRREELRQLGHARRVADARGRLARGSFLPNLSVALDYGVQGRDYQFDRSRDFTALSLVASWNVFNGGQDLARAQQADIEAQRVDAQRAETARMIELEVETAWSSARVAEGAIATAADRLASAKRSFELVRRKHEEGVASQLEFLDARVAYANAALNLVITRYDSYQRRVALEHAAELYVLPLPSRERASSSR